MLQGKAPHTDRYEQHLLDSVDHLNIKRAHGVGSWEGGRVECGEKVEGATWDGTNFNTLYEFYQNIIFKKKKLAFVFLSSISASHSLLKSR